jgi:putative ABC transport system permease protein
LAYVGNDLQDLYGIDPMRIGQVTSLSNAYFGSHDAAGTMRALAAKPDGVLVAQETARDFQLSPGDRLNLRLQSGCDHRYHVIPFSFVDVVREFPTAPRDSFLVANASYVARATHASGAEILLIKTRGDPRLVAQRARVIAKSIPGSVVTDIGSAQRRISSGLTAIDVRALSVIELTFAALCVAAATGLIIALGISERRRMFVILWALGAKRRQLGAFWWSEAMIVTIGGAVAGTILGFGIGYVLVKLLTGVFDPPPERLAIPVGYFVLLLAIGAASTVAAVVAAQMALRHPSVRDLKDL